jgi:hypothetical protein
MYFVLRLDFVNSYVAHLKNIILKSYLRRRMLTENRHPITVKIKRKTAVCLHIFCEFSGVADRTKVVYKIFGIWDRIIRMPFSYSMQ